MRLLIRKVICFLIITIVLAGCSYKVDDKEKQKQKLSHSKTSTNVTIKEIIEKDLPKPFNPRVNSSNLEFSGKWKGDVMPELVSEMKRNGWMELENKREGAMQFFTKEIEGNKVKISVLPIESSGPKTTVYFEMVK